MILKRIIIFSFALCLAIFSSSQVNVTPSDANSCLCTGSADYQSPTPGLVNYILFDGDGAMVTAGSSASGNILLNGLCPEVFNLEVTQGATTTQLVFNIPTTALNPGNATFDGVCSTDPNQNLNTLIPGLANGGTWTSPGGAPIAMPIPAASFVDGWYEYTVPDGACEVTTGVFVNAIQNASPGLTATYLICEDYDPFDMRIYLNGNAEPNGEWFDFNTSVPVSNIYDPATMDSNTFLYMIDTVPGCGPVFSTLTVVENVQPNAGGDAAITVCQNAPAFNMIGYLGGNPDGGGVWQAPNNSAVSGIFNPATYVDGTYEYVISAAVPCVPDNAFLDITFIADNPSGEPAAITVCENGNSVNMLNALNGNPLAGGTWTNPLGLAVDGSFNPSNEAPGVYYYNFPNVVCTPQNVGLTIQIETLPNAGNNNTISVCENTASVNLNGLLSSGTDTGGTWTDGSGQSVNHIFVPPSSGTNFQFNYHVNGNVCPDDNAVFNITLEPLTADPPSSSLNLCSEDDPIDLHTLYPQFPSIVFENPNGTPANTIFNPSPGIGANYVAVIPSTNSCPDGEGTVSITVSQPLFLVDSVFHDVCNSLNVFNLATLDPVAIPSNGDWFDENNTSIAPAILLDFTGSKTFHFIADVNNTCGSNELTAIVTAFSTTDAGPNGEAIFCYYDEPQLLTDLMPATEGNSGSWTFQGTTYSSNVVDPGTSVSGNYVYFIPSNGPCPADAASLFVTIENGINFTAGEDIAVCAGSANPQIGSVPIANTNYTWTPDFHLSNASSAFPFVIIPDEVAADISTTYHVEVNDGVCATEDDVVVTIYALPVFSINDIYELCAGETVTLSPNVVGDYLWSPAYLFDDPTSASPTIAPIQTTAISLLLTNANGCSASDDANVIVHPNPTIIFDPEHDASCSPLYVKFAIDSLSQHVDHLIWEIPGVGIYNDDTLETYLPETGLYDLNVTAFSDFACQSTISFNHVMEVYEIPEARFSSEPEELSTIDPIATFINESIYGELFEWNFAGLGTSILEEPQFEFPNGEPANFNVCLKITSEHGCVDSTCNILHLDNEYIFFAPNAMTPDGDGINDIFLPVMRGFEENTYTLEIFDRWGDLIFTTSEYGKPWTGNVHGGGYYVQEDVYIWQVRVKDKENAEYRVFRGTLTVVR